MTKEPRDPNESILAGGTIQAVLFRGTIKGNSTERFDFKTWISDRYRNFDKDEEFVYKIGVRVI